MHECVCMYVRVFVCERVCVCVCIYMCVCMCVSVCMCVYVCACVCIYIYIYICVCMCVCVGHQIQPTKAHSSIIITWDARNVHSNLCQWNSGLSTVWYNYASYCLHSLLLHSFPLSLTSSFLSYHYFPHCHIPSSSPKPYLQNLTTAIKS